jgi:bifunctional DNase/RNase
MPHSFAVAYSDSSNSGATMLAMEVVGVRVEMPSNQPILLLKEMEGSRFLPIWIGAVEATAIAFAQQGVTPPRPMSHDLMREIIEKLDATVVSVEISSLMDGVFYATINLRTESGGKIAISARPSDAIALALRTHSNILASVELVEEVGIEIPESKGEGDEEVERFRAFLDEINPEDFAG